MSSRRPGCLESLKRGSVHVAAAGFPASEMWLCLISQALPYVPITPAEPHSVPLLLSPVHTPQPLGAKCLAGDGEEACSLLGRPERVTSLICICAAEASTSLRSSDLILQQSSHLSYLTGEKAESQRGSVTNLSQLERTCLALKASLSPSAIATGSHHTIRPTRASPEERTSARPHMWLT